MKRSCRWTPFLKYCAADFQGGMTPLLHAAREADAGVRATIDPVNQIRSMRF